MGDGVQRKLSVFLVWISWMTPPKLHFISHRPRHVVVLVVVHGSRRGTDATTPHIALRFLYTVKLEDDRHDLLVSFFGRLLTEPSRNGLITSVVFVVATR